MARSLSALLIGLIFGAGIALSGMINPAKVLNFFDIFGQWDPSLAFVLGGALSVTALGYRLVLRQPRPVLDNQFHLPQKTQLDRPLILGSVVFGIGWGIAGFCPGGALPALGLLKPQAWIFVTALLCGIWIAKTWRTRSTQALA